MFRYTLLTMAQRITIGSGDGQVDNIPQLTDDQVLTNILNIFYFLIGAVAVIVIIVAGVMYAGSAGNAGTITKAKGMIMYSIVGLIVAVSAFFITEFVIGRF